MSSQQRILIVALAACVLPLARPAAAQNEAESASPPSSSGETAQGADAQQPAVPETVPATDPPQEATIPERLALPPLSDRSLGPRYRFYDDRDALLSSWLGSGLAERLELGPSAGGRELFGIQFGGPGPLPLDQRTAIFLVGGLDGVSIAGGEAILAITDALLATSESLPPDATFVALPWANPDGLARWLAGGCSDGRNDRPQDDDLDGRADEDLPDDLDGDGVVLEMLVEDPRGPWALAEDGRFLRPAAPGESPRFVRTREGRDDDGDGAFNEDPAGGVVLDRNFPVNWRGRWEGSLSGPWPLSEPGSMALAKLALSRRTALFLVFQGNHGRLAMPGGLPAAGGALALPLEEDLPTFGTVLDAFVRATGRAGGERLHLHEAYRGAQPGTAVDWCYAALGALACEIGVWGPEVDQEDPGALEGAFRPNGNPAAVRESSLRLAPGQETGVFRSDGDWSRWLDDTRGGLGFAPWQPFDLGPTAQGLVGGWEPYTCFNPPADVLPRALAGLDAFVLELVRGLPRLEIDVEKPRRDDRIGILRVRVRNMGALPTGVGPVGGKLGTRVGLDLPQGVRLLAGEMVNEIGHLPAHGKSRDFEWLLVAPPESRFRVWAESNWTPRVTREVTL